jgi:Holliday junction DNA helicase RuvA
MIVMIKGKIIDTGLDNLVIDTGQIGYKVWASSKTISDLSHQKTDVTLFTHLSIRETSHDLYGFSTKEEKSFFELLLTINGIGPKSAMTILATANVQTLTEGIQSGDANYLSKISGIGKKTAEKIMLGLKDKLGALEIGDSRSHGTDAIDALTSLGYSEKDARETISKIKDKNSAEEIIKEALKLLSNK